MPLCTNGRGKESRVIVSNKVVEEVRDSTSRISPE